MEIIIASAVTVGTLALVDGVKYACKKYLKRMNNKNTSLYPADKRGQ